MPKLLKHLQLFETFSINENFYDDLKGYTMYGNKEKQIESGFVVGDRVEYDYEDVQGNPVQTVDGLVDMVFGQPENPNSWNSPIKNWVVVVKMPNGNKLVVGTDTTSNRWGDIKDLHNLVRPKLF